MAFSFHTPASLGIPLALDIWHDNSGKGKDRSWFLDKVVIVNRKTRKWYLFLCNKWLAIDESDGRTKRHLVAATQKAHIDPADLLQSNIYRKLFDDHIWLSVGYRKSKSHFTRVQRLSCCLATLFLSMVANAMWYNIDDTSQAEQVGFKVGPISFTMQELFSSFMSSLILLPPVFIITTLFIKSEPRQKNNDCSGKAMLTLKSTGRSQQRNKCRQGLPYWCMYIAWGMVVLSVICSAFFTLLYSFQWGGDTSRAWLLTFLLSFFQSVFLLQPIQVIVLALLTTFILKQDSGIVEFTSKLGQMETIDPKQAAEVDVDDPAISPEAVEIQERCRLDGLMRVMMRQILAYTILLMLLVLVCTGNQNTNDFLQNNNLKHMFTADISMDRSSLYEWVRSVLVLGLYYTEDYSGGKSTEYDQEFLNNMCSYRLGPPTLRQLRVTPDGCKHIPWVARAFSKHCTNWYSSDTLNRRSYSPKWSRLLNGSEFTPYTSGVESAFLYKSQADLNSSSFQGLLDSYEGGGYIASLGNTKEEALSTVDLLQAHEWLDLYTRVVFVEFNVWNANTNLFNLFIMSFEFPPIGGMGSWTQIDSVQLYRYTGGAGLVNLLVEIFLAIYVLILTVFMIKDIVKQKLAYWSNPWNIIFVISVVMFYLAFIFYVMRSIWTIRTVENMMNNKGVAVNFQRVVMWNELFLLFLGLVTFITQIRMLHLLRYSKVIAYIGATLACSSTSLLSFSLIALVAFMAFSSGAFQLFYTMEDYSSLHKTSSTLTQAFLGSFNFQSVQNEFGYFGAFYLFAYLLMMLLIVMNMFVTILNTYISAMKENKGHIPKDYQVMDHLLNMLGKLVPRFDINSETHKNHQ